MGYEVNQPKEFETHFSRSSDATLDGSCKEHYRQGEEGGEIKQRHSQHHSDNHKHIQKADIHESFPLKKKDDIHESLSLKKKDESKSETTTNVKEHQTIPRQTKIRTSAACTSIVVQNIIKHKVRDIKRKLQEEQDQHGSTKDYITRPSETHQKRREGATFFTIKGTAANKNALLQLAGFASGTSDDGSIVAKQSPRSSESKLDNETNNQSQETMKYGFDMKNTRYHHDEKKEKVSNTLNEVYEDTTNATQNEDHLDTDIATKTMTETTTETTTNESIPVSLGTESNISGSVTVEQSESMSTTSSEGGSTRSLRRKGRKHVYHAKPLAKKRENDDDEKQNDDYDSHYNDASSGTKVPVVYNNNYVHHNFHHHHHGDRVDDSRIYLSSESSFMESLRSYSSSSRSTVVCGGD